MTSNSKLHEAISTSDIDAARKALASGARVHCIDADGLPALHAAISCSNALEMILLLMGAGASVNQVREEDERTALHIACEEGPKLDIVEALLASGASPNAKDMSGWTPLHCASYIGWAPCMERLLRHGAEVNTTNASGQTSLLLACESCASQWVGRDTDYTEVVKLLLDHGAAVDGRDLCEDTPLHLAVRAGNAQVVDQLCSRGADVNSKSGLISGGLTPLHLCSALGNCSIMKTLLSTSGVEFDAEESREGMTPLMISVQSGHEGTTLLLLQAGSDPYHVSLSGLTALHLAAQEGQTRVLQILLGHYSSFGSINPDKENLQGTGPSPLHLACYAGHVDAVHVLLSAGANVCAVDPNQETPLHVAVRGRHTEITRALFECETGKSAALMKNKRGQVPRDLVPEGQDLF